MVRNAAKTGSREGLLRLGGGPGQQGVVPQDESEEGRERPCSSPGETSSRRRKEQVQRPQGRAITGGGSGGERPWGGV